MKSTNTLAALGCGAPLITANSGDCVLTQPGSRQILVIGTVPRLYSTRHGPPSIACSSPRATSPDSLNPSSFGLRPANSFTQGSPYSFALTSLRPYVW